MRKLILAIIGFFMAINLAFAAVDLNSADEATLDSLKGVGPVKAKAIADERKKNGPFKNLDDVQARVKGIGPATIAGWKKDGAAVVGGGSTPVADTKADTKAAAKKDAPKTDGKADTKATAKADAKADTKASAKGDAKADTKAAAKADTKADAKSSAKGDAKADAPKADAKSDKKDSAKKDSKKDDAKADKK